MVIIMMIIKTYIGYGLTMDLDLQGFEDFPDQDSDLLNVYDYDRYHNDQEHSDLTDESKSLFTFE